MSDFLDPASRAPVPAGAVLLTRDADVARWVQGCAAGSGTTVVVRDPRDVLGAWTAHPLVLLGADAVAAAVDAALPRHPQVHLVCDDRVDADVLRRGVGLGLRSVLDPSTGSRALTVLLDAVRDPRPPGRVVAVVSGSGGAGGTTFGAAVSLVAARSRTTAWIVADPSVPDPALLLGSEPAPGLDWTGLERAGGAVSPVSLRETLPVHHGVALLAGAGPSRVTVREAVEAARASHDLVVLDLDLRDVELAREVLPRCDAVRVVVRARAVGLASADARLRPLVLNGVGSGAGAGIMVRGGGVPDHVVEQTLGLPVVHRMRDERRLDEWIDLGAGVAPGRRSALVGAARRLVGQVDAASVPAPGGDR